MSGQQVSPAVEIDRTFVRLPAGRVHYRSTAPPTSPARPPLYMAHAGPGCSRGLEPLIAELGRDRQVVAPDMLGNGDSDPPPSQPTTIADYAAHAVQLLDRLGLEQVDVYGDHAGAQIGAELAAVHPHRVRRLALDGAPLFPPALKAELFARYAPPLPLEEYGGHLAWAWGFVRDLSLHFPYYRTDVEHRLNASPIAPLEVRHALVVDILKAQPTFHLSYGAAFSHDLAARLAELRCPTLFMAASADPLSAYLETAAALTPGSRLARVARADKAATVRAFLDEDAP